MQNLTVTTVQTSLYWENPGANLAMLEEKIRNAGTVGDLIVLPEMFTTGFTMNAPALAEPMNLTTCRWMKQMAAQTGAVITGSIIIRENSRYYNRMLWVEPDGQIDFYDKRHLFRMADEHLVFSAGEKRLIKELKGWKIAPFVCYDLRFPVWSRNTEAESYDLAIYIASWPAARNMAWNTLLPARAIENQCYVTGVNRTGTDGKAIIYEGNSGIWNFLGEKINDSGHAEVIQTGSLDMAKLQSFRSAFPAFRDSDRFSIHQTGR